MREGHRDIANLLCEAGGKLNYDEETAAGTLCELARVGDLEKVKLLLAGGCDANAADYDKRTCLHLAASVGNLHIVEQLIEFSANVNYQDRNFSRASNLAHPTEPLTSSAPPPYADGAARRSSTRCARGIPRSPSSSATRAAS